MKFSGCCFSSLGCGELTLGPMLQLARRFGVDQIEVRSLNGTVDCLAELDRENQACGGRLGQNLAAGEVSIALLGTSVRLTDDPAACRNTLARFARWADELNVPWIRIFDGDWKVSPNAEPLGSELLGWWQEYRARSQVRSDLLVETHDSLLDAERIRHFLAAFPTSGLLWDTHHTWRKGGEAPAVTWAAIGASVRHMHVKDSVTAPEAAVGYRTVLPGEGEFPMQALQTALLGSNYPGRLSLEWERYWQPTLPKLEVALQAMLDAGWW